MTAVPLVVPSARPVPAGAPAVRAVLRLVPQRARRARRAPFVAVVVGLLVSGLLGLLALNTVLAQDAFRLHELQVQGRTLADQEQELLKQVEARQAPGALAERAAGLGMVPGGAPSFLRLPDGVVSGAGVPAQAPLDPSATTEPTGQTTDQAAAAPAPDGGTD